ncbi:MAG: hypothetical protein V3U27_19505, partial [Candidatus Tectomicrobia bacterium]
VLAVAGVEDPEGAEDPRSLLLAAVLEGRVRAALAGAVRIDTGVEHSRIPRAWAGQGLVGKGSEG